MKRFKVTVGSSEIWYTTYLVDANNEEEAKTLLENSDLNYSQVGRKHWETDYSEVLEVEEVEK